MSQDQIPDVPEPIEAAPSPDSADPRPAEMSTGGAKLFVIFFLILVPLIGMAVLATLIYGLLIRG